MNLKLPLPPGRTYDQIRNHYEVEKEIAGRLKAASREERKGIYAGMYTELFAKVPDHSRLTRREDDAATRKANLSKFALIREAIHPTTVFGEFASGDCRFAMEVARRVKQVYAIDISDQRNPADIPPPNFELITYDGYDLSRITDDSIDLLFSDQLIEHFHPDDTALHFQTAARILKNGGKYILRTPHLLTGPHDISKYFSDEPQGFHLKEWTYGGIQPVLKHAGFSKISARMMRKRIAFWLPFGYFTTCENILSRFPHVKARGIAKNFIHEIILVAEK